MNPVITSVTDKHFIDWESHFFGYGYGTGEEPIIAALKQFFDQLEDGRVYDHRKMETQFGPLAAWLLINDLCRADILDYGTSSRHGFLSEKGELLKQYFDARTPADLLEILDSIDPGYVQCFPDNCQCDSPCENPLF